LEWSLGTRPLAYFDTSRDAERWGQNWGLPPYRWENHRSTGFEWLRSRIAWEAEFFHGCRLDHLRGYFRAYMFPWPGGARHVEFSRLTEEEAARLTGGLLPRFVPGPDEDPTSAAMNELQGREIIGHLIEAAGGMDLVAEIMGALPDYMTRTLQELELANLSFPQLERTAAGTIRPPGEFRELSLVAYANHDNAPLAQLLLHLRQKALGEPGGKAAGDLQALLEFAGAAMGDDGLDDKLLAGLQGALFRTRSRLAILMCSDLLGIPLRFNLPGSYGRGTWGDRLEIPLGDLWGHPLFGPRIALVREMIRRSGRSGATGAPS
jgi:4-alpha-glucanotransferase